MRHQVEDGFIEEVEVGFTAAVSDGVYDETQDLTAPATYLQQSEQQPSASTSGASGTLGVPCIYHNNSEWMLDALEYLPKWEGAAKSQQHQVRKGAHYLQVHSLQQTLATTNTRYNKHSLQQTLATANTRYRIHSLSHTLDVLTINFTPYQQADKEGPKLQAEIMALQVL
jgi:hypothetical protein